jgi:hypothetical protein
MCYSMRSRVSAVARTPVKPNRWNSGQMTRRVFSFRLPILAALIVAAAILLLTLPVGFTPSAQAQFFDGGFFPFMQNPWGRSSRRSRHQGYGERRSQPDADYSKAPAPPKRPDTPAQTNVLVFGDAMADWLAYGLELSFAESPEMGVIRKPRTNSGLIRQEVRNDPRGEHPDWPKLIREVLATEKPDFIVMMIGLNDRRPIREQRPPQPAIVKSGQPGENPTADPKKAQEGAQKQPAQQPALGDTAAAAEPARTYEFRSEKWVELYIKRIDETIAALKSAGVPVFLVGLPPVRGARSTSDFSFLNDLFRSRADKGGVVYVDVWDGFVDEAGNYALYGPDVEGQNRRLRTPDGVYFTQAGARKLAHFFERELQRWMTSRATPVALPVEEPASKTVEQQQKSDSPAGKTRPLTGPVISLNSARSTEEDDVLLGGGKSSQTSTPDAVASKVLVNGESVPAPAGRADDFAWPRREIAPVGSDPAVTVATLPMTPMKSERRAAPEPEGPAAPAATEQARPAAPGQSPRTATRQSARRQQQTGWFGNWGGWQQQPQQRQYRQAPQQRSQPGFFPFLFRR